MSHVAATVPPTEGWLFETIFGTSGPARSEMAPNGYDRAVRHLAARPLVIREPTQASG
jgi:hypothetical protein